MKKLISLFLIINMLLLLLSAPLYGFSDDYIGIEFQGKPVLKSKEVKTDSLPSYIFKLTENIEVDAEPVYEEELLYKTSDMNLIYELEQLGLIEYYCKNETFSLDGEVSDYRFDMLSYEYVSNTDISASTTNVTVGIIDSGLMDNFSYYTNATVLKGVNTAVAASDTDRHNTNDNLGHGTFVTSIICHKDIGLAKNISIVPLKCSNSADGSDLEEAYIIEAIYEAVNTYNCDVINMSLGGEENNLAMEEAVAYAIEKGTIVVAASGNITDLTASSGNDNYMYPASYDGVISVGAVIEDKTVWKKSYQNDRVDFVAPGVKVAGLSFANGSLINTANGTSFSAPVVTATVALALSLDKSLSLSSITDLLINTSEDLGTEGKDNSYGYGLVNPGLVVATLIKDSSNLVISSYNQQKCVSAYIDNKKINHLAKYKNNGQMISIDNVTKLVNYNILDDIFEYMLFSLDKKSYIPESLRKFSVSN